jgi:alpha-D-xyloside xylohydrolase
MDWRTDQSVWDIGDQFMFGPDILVNPVTQEGATSRQLYLPKTSWYDFWTGRRINGGQRLEAPAPLDRLPLYLKAGSILPLGPEIEYAADQPGAPIELRVYPGSDGSFDLYEDAGDSYAYEKGQHSVIPIHWDDKSGTLTIEKRIGQYPGMIETRKFHIVFVRDGHGAGTAPATTFDRELTYKGQNLITTVP